MRIAVFGRSLPVHAMGGLEVHLQMMVEGLASRGHDVEVFTTRRRDGVRGERQGNLTIHFLSWTLPGRYEGGYFHRSAKAFFDRCRKDPFDAILTESSAVCGVLKRHRFLPAEIPVVWMAHGTWKAEIETKRKVGMWRPKQLFGILLCLNHWIRDRKYIRMADRVIACGKGLHEELVRVYGLDPNRVVFQSNGVNTSVFMPDDARRGLVRKDLGIGSGDIVLLLSSRLHPEKGIGPFLDLVAELVEGLPKFWLIIVGDGTERQDLEKKAAVLNLQGIVRFLGFRPREELPALYNAADIFVFPSRRAEGQPISLIEAMSSGLPIVANRVGWMSSLIEDGVTGILVDPDDEQTFLAGILGLANNTERLSALGKAARKKAVEEFSIDRSVAEVESILEQMVAGVR